MLNRLGFLSLATACLSLIPTLEAQEAPRYAGPSREGFVLPNGWTVSPAGQQVALKDLPLNILPLPDSRRALVATSGYNAHELSLVDLEKKTILDHPAVRQSWFGLAASPRLERLWWSGGGANVVHRFLIEGEKLTRQGEEPEGRRAGAERSGARRGSGAAWRSTPQRNLLYSLDIDQGTIVALDPASETEVKSAPVGSRPYDVAIARSAGMLYVSDWAGRSRAGRRPGRPPRRSPGSPSASIRTRSPCIRRTTGSSSPARRATASP